MRDFLDIAHSLQRDGSAAPVDFEPVFKGISILTAAHSKASLDLDNIESVFAAFEMAALLGMPLGELSISDVKQLGLAIRRLIVRTLEVRIQYPVVGSQVRPPVPYGDFADLVREINSHGSVNSAVITFNYDVTLDYAFHFYSVRSNYCLQSEAQLHETPLLKLHGSLNWTRCNKCESVIPWSINEYLQRYDRIPDLPHVRLEIASHLENFSHCGGTVSGYPVIVPPTWNKTQYHSEIAGVWRRAARELSDAENIFVIGYSLPDTDQFFRLLHALGTIGTGRIRRIWVLNPDRTGTVRKRFENLLGQAVLSRFEVIESSFGNAVKIIKKELADDP